MKAHMTLLALIALTTIALPEEVAASDLDEARVGAAILSCFHPTANFHHVKFQQAYEKSRGRTAIDGVIYFAGGFSGNSYRMKFTLVFREVDGIDEMRVVPGEDSAPFRPNPDCRLRSWTEL